MSENRPEAPGTTPPEQAGAASVPARARRWRSGLASLVQRRPVAVLVFTALVAAVVTGVIVGMMVAPSATMRSAAASPSSPAPSSATETDKHVSVFLKSTVTGEQTRAIASALRKLPSVEEVRFVSQQEAYATFKEQFKDAPSLLATIKPGDVPASFRVTLKAASGFCGVAGLSTQPGVSLVTGPAEYSQSC